MKWCLALWLAPAAFPQAAALPANASNLKGLTLEELSQIEVTSAGRKEEKLSSVAAAMSVITQDDIRRTGVRNIPEALRLATGLEVALFNNGSWPISARGFATVASNKIQVFMDGRSLYTPLFGGVFWDQQHTMIEDIDRIEVIRGPGATLWGGNAVNTVINIITKSTKDTQGGMFVAGGGAGERGFTALRYGGKIGSNTSYRVYGQYFDRDSLALPTGGDAKDPYQVRQGGFRVDTSLTSDDTLTVEGDTYSGDAGLLNRPDLITHGTDFLARWTHRFSGGSELQIQSYYDRTSRLVPQQFQEVRNTYDLDLQYHFNLGDRHDIVLGLGDRVSNDATQRQALLFFDPSGRHLALYSAFVQDEIALKGDRLHLILGLKAEHYTFRRMDAQPSVRLVYTPRPSHVLWGGISRAVRIPTQFDEDLRIALPTIVLVRGDREFDRESLIAYEAGYRFLPQRHLSLDIATYYNHYDDLRSQERVAGATVLGNNLRAHTFGAEVKAVYQVRPWWRFTAGYANLQRRFSFAPGSTDTSAGLQEGMDPRNQFSLRSAMDLPHNWELDFWVRHVSALETPVPPSVPSYTVFDVRAGWRPRAFLEFSLTGRNLPDMRHQEFGPAGELVRRTVYATTTWRF